MSFRDSQRYRKVYSYYRPAPRPTDTFGVDKEYVDAALQSIDWKQSVRFASIGAGDDYNIDRMMTNFHGTSLNDEDRIL